MTELVLVSPVPPMKTGTANYLKLIVRDLSKAGITKITVVYDHIGFNELSIRPSIESIQRGLTIDLGIQIALVEKSRFHEEWHQTVVYFTANNHYHFYVYDLLLRPKRARRLLVIHEPSCMMAATSYFEWDRERSRHEYVDHLYAQFGNVSRHLLDDIKDGKVIESLQYEILGFDYSKFLPDVIFVHSLFARAKLQMEMDGLENTPVHVASHPEEDPVDSTKHLRPASPLRFGIFGFVNPSKRIYEIMNSFKNFVDYAESSNLNASEAQLIIVGQLPPSIYYSPKAHAKKTGIFKHCEFYGYVDKEKFNELYFSCSLIFNLRFPSCGETTGLSGYNGIGPRIAMSDYHAFRELPADFFVRLDNEEIDILTIMLEALHMTSSDAGSRLAKEKDSAGYAIAREFLGP